MTDEREALAAEYASALEHYLDGSGESALTRAYDVGRQALAHGLGVLDIATIHRDAVQAAVLSAKDSQSRFVRATEFFAESLAPFEMTFRGYEGANQSLIELNQTLNTQNVELRHAKAAAEVAVQELESFSYSVAHDLRVPLRHIDGFSQILLEGWSAALDDQGKNYLGRVRGSVKRMGRLIEDLLQLSRVTRADLNRQRVDVSRLARRVAKDLQHADPSRDVRFVIEDQLVAEADPHLLEVVYGNLLGNAWKFTAKTTSATVEVGHVDNGEQRTYFVRDNGAGFDPAHAGRLFTPFQRLHRETDFPGTGIGLATVQRIVRRHGGDIWAESAVNQGAMFLWTLSPS